MSRLFKLKKLDFQLVSDKDLVNSTLRNVEYKCQIINNILKTNLTQTFVSSNSSSQYTESTYYFPIQEGICLESFVAKYNDQKIKGIIKEKQQAEKEYQENKDRGNLVSYAQTQKINDEDYCQIKLGNLPPNQQVEIILVFSQQLNCYLNKFFTAQIPLVCCQDEIQAKFGKNLFSLDLFCTGKITYAEIEGHPIQKNSIDSNTVRFNIIQTQMKTNLDLNLLFSFEGMFEPQVIFGSSQIFSNDLVKQAIMPASHSVMVSFIPDFNENVTSEINDTIRAAINQGDNIFSDNFQQKLNQELINHLDSSRSEFIFLLDRSGSMSGQPIQKACQALILFLKSLPNDSFFNVISFGSRYQHMFPSSVQYNSQNLKNSIQKIQAFTADLGGTEIHEPLQQIFSEKRILGYNRQVFLLTDGQVTNPKEVINLIKKNNKFTRTHCIGFGSEVDQYLINQSSQAGRGISRMVNYNSDISQVILEMLLLCITPALDNFKIKYDENIFETIYPQIDQLPCFFKDEIINIHLFFKAHLGMQNMTEQQKQIEIEYFDSHKKINVKKLIKLEMQDCFTCNPDLQQSVFKIGKQLYLNERIPKASNILENYLVQQSVDYQILNEKTAIICVIETLNDEKQVMFKSLKTQQQSKQQQNNYLGSQQDQFSTFSWQRQNNHNLLDMLDDGSNGDAFSSYQKYCYELKQSINQLDSYEKKTVYLKSNELLSSQFTSFSHEVQKTSNVPSKQQQQTIYQQISYLESNQPKSQNNQQKVTQPIDLLDLYDSINEQKQNNQQNKLDQNNQNFLWGLRGISDQQPFQNQVPKLEDLLNLVNSQGVWKFDENLIKQCSKLDSNLIKQLCYYFNSNDAFMTLFITIFLELKYVQDKPKWILITKKSLTFIQSQLKQGAEIIQIQQKIKQQI